MRHISLICAAGLAVLILSALGWACWDPMWRNVLKDFQVAVGGVAALAAALVAHHANSSSATEAHRKDRRDREGLRQALIIQSRLDAYRRGQAYTQLSEELLASQQFLKNKGTYKDLGERIFHLPRGTQIDKAWENVNLFSSDTAISLYSMIYWFDRIDVALKICSTVPDKKISAHNCSKIVEIFENAAKASKNVVDALDEEFSQKIRVISVEKLKFFRPDAMDDLTREVSTKVST